MTPFLLIPLAYVVGATPTSHWVATGICGVDLRRHGSGNLGATNVFRVLGWGAALPVLIVDVFKGWLPTWLFPRLDAPDATAAWALAYGSAAILGHVFSFWVGFRGGKGVATSAGVLAALAPWALLSGSAVWLIAVVTTRIVSVGSLLAAVTVPLVVALTRGGEGGLLAFTGGLAVFVIWAHRANIKRLLAGEENRFSGGDSEGSETVR